MNLENTRRLIDDVDTHIVALLNRRAKLARQISGIKTQAGLPIIDRGREEIVLRRVVGLNAGHMDDCALLGIYREILSESRRIQNDAVSKAGAVTEVSK
jgi:chorismate mutase / prephenate dehydratase